MGSCISKYKPNKKPYSHHYNKECPVQDKLIISSQVHPSPLQPPTVHIPPSKKNVIEPTIHSPSPSSSSSTSASTNSTTITTAYSSSSSTSSSSATSSLFSSSSSYLVSKERSFSNDFLRSCIKENPHVIRVVDHDGPGKLTINQENTVRKFERPTKLSSSVVVSSKQSVLPKRVGQSTPQKRASSPPVVHRQKSFRRESADLHHQTNHNPNMKSSTPLSRRNSSGYYSSNSSPLRNNRDSCNGIPRYSSSPNRFSDHQREYGFSKSKGNVPIHDHYYYSPSTRNKENLRPGSPLNRNRDGYGSSRKREATCTTTHHVHPDHEVIVEENASSSSVLGEVVYSDKDFHICDIDNPHISLDCFIFL